MKNDSKKNPVIERKIEKEGPVDWLGNVNSGGLEPSFSLLVKNIHANNLTIVLNSTPPPNLGRQPQKLEMPDERNGTAAKLMNLLKPLASAFVFLKLIIQLVEALSSGGAAIT